jgi:DNA-binding NarL/FixJ family response regulator
MTQATPISRDPQPRVLVVDPDERIRESLAGLLGIGDRCIVVGSAGHPTLALAMIAADLPDVVVLDPRLPDLNDGRAFIARLREIAPEVRIVVMGADLEQSLDGVDAVIRKTYRPRELIEAICRAAVVAHA